MKELRLSDLSYGVKGILHNEGTGEVIKGVSIDSRKVTEGDLFIAINGERMDGHDFIGEAIKNGCRAVMVHKDIEDTVKVPVVRVEDTLIALHKMAAYYISLFNIPKIAVTGSTGKTTTKELIASVLSKKYKVIKNIGNYNNHIGLPLSVFNVEEKHEIAIFEMGMSSLGEIDLLASIIKPDVAVITNIGLSHIEHLKSQQNILKAKMEVANYFNHENVLIINFDDIWLKTLDKESFIYKLVKIGSDKESDYVIREISSSEEGINFTLTVNGNLYFLQMKVQGRHNAYNAAMAIGCGIHFKVDMKDMGKAISEYEGYDMRLKTEKAQDGTIVLNDVYNASPDSMKAAIQTLTSIKGKRYIAILSDMLEMGSFTEKYHKEIGDYAAEARLDLLITVGKFAEYIAIEADVKTKEMKILHFQDKKELLNSLDNLIMPGDVILVKGSRGMKMEEIVQHILERG